MLSDQDRVQYFLEKTLLRRIGEPYDHCPCNLFLASDTPCYIHGETLPMPKRLLFIPA